VFYAALIATIGITAAFLFSYCSNERARAPRSYPHPRVYTQFAQHDAVEACGGPQAYAALLPEARLRGEETAFNAAFEGTRAGAEQTRRKKAPLPAAPPATEERQAPVPREHATRVIAEQEATKGRGEPPRQRTLFD
jgi:hypothetical protein